MLSETLRRGLLGWFVGTGLFATASAQQPAFPGAEGFGAFATGGRSGTVYHVTNLSDSGSGSFRDAVSQTNRTIVFDVSGIINFSSALSITKSNLTIAGQTAPGDGISTKGWMTEVKARNVIVRYLHCRPGDINCPSSMDDDAFHFDSASNCIADHVSASWSMDEALSTTKSTNVTVQWCMIALPLNHSCHDEGSGIQDHGYGSLIRYAAGGITYHHNLYAHCLGRNPRGPSDRIRLDFVNNVVYNSGSSAGYNEDDSGDGGTPLVYTNFANYVGNYLIAGANTTQNPPRIFRSGVSPASETQIYQTNNFVDANKNGLLDGTDVGWSSFVAKNASTGFTTNFTRFAFPQVTTDTPNAAYVRVLSAAGASVVRDVVDSGVVSNVLNQNGNMINSQTEVGGWPALNSLAAPLDTDQDGMPDFWELAVGLSTNNAADRNNLTADGYTRLEGYLNWLADPHARVQSNSSVNVELRRYTAGLSNTSYTVSSASNGVVSLLGDGHTAQFTPTSGFIGLGSFVFAASGTPGVLTNTVSVLVSPVAAPLPAPGFTGTPTNGLAPLLVTFTDTSTGSITNRFWNFGDTSTTNTTTNSLTHSYNAGTFTVSLTVSGEDGASNLTRASYIVATNIAPPVAAFTASSTNGTAPLLVNFTDTSTGSITNRFWNFGDGDTTNFAAATNPSHTYAPGLFTAALTVSGPAGNSAFNRTITVVTEFQAWQLQNFGCTNCPQADANTDADGDGMSNTNEFLAGTSPTSALSALQIIAMTQDATNIVITWTTAGGRTNAVQASAAVDTNFADITGLIAIPGSGDATTNYTDSGGGTNAPSRFYRIRLQP